MRLLLLCDSFKGTIFGVELSVGLGVVEGRGMGCVEARGYIGSADCERPLLLLLLSLLLFCFEVLEPVTVEKRESGARGVVLNV